RPSGAFRSRELGIRSFSAASGKYREFLIPAWSNRASYASPRRTLGDSMIEVEHLKKSLGSLLVLDRQSLRLDRGGFAVAPAPSGAENEAEGGLDPKIGAAQGLAKTSDGRSARPSFCAHDRACSGRPHAWYSRTTRPAASGSLDLAVAGI